jgi:glycerol-3-phosphate dehydrogenase
MNTVLIFGASFASYLSQQEWTKITLNQKKQSNAPSNYTHTSLAFFAFHVSSKAYALLWVK